MSPRISSSKQVSNWMTSDTYSLQPCATALLLVLQRWMGAKLGKRSRFGFTVHISWFLLVYPYQVNDYQAAS